MEKVLYIKANPKEIGDSYTLRLSQKFIEKYKEKNPNSQIIELDLYKAELEYPTMDIFEQTTYDEDNKYNKFVKDFITYDKYIIASPMWNFSIPSILKTYIDYIVVARKTFRYTEKGPEGLMKGKKAIHITTSGGSYKEGSKFEMSHSYLKLMFNFMGILDFDKLALEGTKAEPSEKIEEKLKTLISSIDNYIERF
jgi:FMN-dependent NADH-azoreductase